MTILGKEGLLKKDDLKIKEVDLGNDEFVYVREMSGHERDLFERSLLKEKRDAQGKVVSYEQSLEDFRAKLAVVTLCDENGKMLLEPKDAPLLSRNMSATKLAKIVEAAQELNKISEEEKETILKNSEVGPADNSSSDSVEN